HRHPGAGSGDDHQRRDRESVSCCGTGIPWHGHLARDPQVVGSRTAWQGDYDMADDRWSDEAVDQVLGNLLRAGVLTAAFVVLAGGILYLIRHGSEPAGYGVFKSEPADLRS